VSVPALPVLWTQQVITGSAANDAWKTVNTTSDSAPNAAGTNDPPVVTDKVVVVQVVSRPRSKKAKQKFYKMLVEELQTSCGIAPTDVMVSIVENSDEDWSFGLGRAQFLEGDL